MPRVTQHTARKSKYERLCQTCRKPMEPGQRYYYWSRRFGSYGQEYYQHVECGYPRPTQLSSRKTAVVDEAVQVAQGELSSWSPELPELDPGETTFEVDFSDLSAALESVADEAEGVGEEYESSADNMPESLQYGEQAEAMRDVAERLREWAEGLRSWEPTDDTLELPERDAYEDEEGWLADVEAAFENLVETLRSDAEDQLNEVPEYEY